ncbi:MAG: 50S ribosomal protein L1 [Actinobacteria bacterium]|nr:50S ribosomal protein L1 [Actinomycetota bacterium]
MAKKGKNYRAAFEAIDREKLYTPRVACKLLKDTAKANFDQTVDVALRLGVDPRQADQMIRGAVSLPHGTGKEVRVAVVTSGENVVAAQEAGADHVGGDDLIAELEKGELIEAIDAVVASPDMMGKLGRLGKTLGPRGLMPNPKSGTVTQDVAKAVREIKGGRVEYRVDRTGNVHAVLGKVSFEVDQLVDNFMAFFDEILRQRPASAKGRYVQTIAISSTMGPSVRIDAGKARAVIEDEDESAA